MFAQNSQQLKKDIHGPSSSGPGLIQQTLLMIESLKEEFILFNKVDKFHSGTTLWRTRGTPHLRNTL